MGCISRTRCISPVPARSSLNGRYVGNWDYPVLTLMRPHVRSWQELT